MIVSRWICGLCLAISAVWGAAAAAQGASAVLFHNVNVVGMQQEGVQKAQDVLVRDGRIQRIGPTGAGGNVDRDTIIVEGNGRYLMPGLSEMHAHLPGPGPQQAQNTQDLLLLYLAHGVTTIRGMLGNPSHLQLREQLEKHEVLGPRLFTAGPSFNGQSTPDIESARSRVREQAAAGYDFLKLHPGLKRDVFDAIVAEARKANISFQGHVSEDVGVPHALQARQKAIDHLDGYVQALVAPGCLKGPTAPGAFGIGVVHCVDDKRIADIVRQTKAAGTAMVPTAILLHQWVRQPPKEELLARPAARYMPRRVLEGWYDQVRNFIGGQAVPQERADRYIGVIRSLLREMHAQAVPILLGSDAPQVFNIPGDSALSELALYAETGIPPFDALRTATAAPAEFLGAADRFGTVREGLEADLILIEENPLQDVRAVRKLAGVMARGRWVSREELDKRLNELAARVSR
ncbi:MAG TPA: amidohydrolase family protein [Steroidobacteraceae bacterium]